MAAPAVSVAGTGLTTMDRRDRSLPDMTRQVVADALDDAGVAASDVDLVVFANAVAGRLSGQGCIRGQVFLGEMGLSRAGIVNVDNSCASGASALHLAVLASKAGTGTVLAVGAEKMWTGDRAATLAGIEDGVPEVDRQYLHERLENPSGSVLMALNAGWARTMIDERGATPEQFATVVVKSRRHAAANPYAQFRDLLDVDDVLGAPPIAPPLTRLMCSSFTDGAAAVVLRGTPKLGAPRIRSSTVRSGNGALDYHDRLAETAVAAWEDAALDPSDVDVLELHDATSPEELFALESLGFFKPGDAGPATLAGATTVGGDAVTVNPSGGLLSRGHALAATGLAQVVELADQLRGRAGARQVERPRLAVAANTGGMIGSHAGTTDAAFIGIHVLEAG